MQNFKKNSISFNSKTMLYVLLFLFIFFFQGDLVTYCDAGPVNNNNIITLNDVNPDPALVPNTPEPVTPPVQTPTNPPTNPVQMPTNPVQAPLRNPILGPLIAPIVEPLINRTDQAFIDTVFRWRVIPRFLFTLKFQQIYQPIFMEFPMYFRDSLIPVEHIANFIKYHPYICDEHIFNSTRSLIHQHLVNFDASERDFLSSNIFINPETTRELIGDFREAHLRFITERIARINSLNPSETLSVTDFPRFFPRN